MINRLLFFIGTFLIFSTTSFGGDFKGSLKQRLEASSNRKKFLLNELRNTTTSYKKAVINNFIGLEFQKEFALDSAEFYHLNAYALLKIRHSDHKEMAVTLNKLGIVAIYSQDYVTAKDYFIKALKIFDASSEKANAYNNLALTEKYLGKPDESIKAYSKALRIFEKLSENVKAIDVRLNISALHLAQGNDSIALDQLIRAESYASQYGLDEQLYRARSNMAPIYRNMGNHGLAHKLHQECDIYFREQNLLNYQIVNLNNLAILYGELKEYKEEIVIYHKIISLCEANNLVNYLIGIKANLGATLLLTKDYKEAEHQLKEAELLALEANNPTFLLEIYASLGETLKSSGRGDEALSYREKEIALKDSLKEVERLKTLIETESKMRNQDLVKEVSKKSKELSNTSSQARLFFRLGMFLVFVTGVTYLLYFLKKRKARQLGENIAAKDQDLEHLTDTVQEQEEIIESLSTKQLRPYPKNLTQLTEREKEALGFLAEGKSDVEIAEGMHLSPSTIRTHLRKAYAKINVKNRAQATQFVKDHQL